MPESERRNRLEQLAARGTSDLRTVLKDFNEGVAVSVEWTRSVMLRRNRGRAAAADRILGDPITQESLRSTDQPAIVPVERHHGKSACRAAQSAGRRDMPIVLRLSNPDRGRTARGGLQGGGGGVRHHQICRRCWTCRKPRKCATIQRRSGEHRAASRLLGKPGERCRRAKRCGFRAGQNAAASWFRAKGRSRLQDWRKAETDPRRP